MTASRLVASLVIAGACLRCSNASATVNMYFDFKEWQSALKSVTTIGFGEFPTGTGIFNQYLDQGVVFPDEDCFVIEADFFTNDGHGLHSSNSTGQILMRFMTPQYGVASHFPGDNWVTLSNGGSVLYVGPPWKGPPGTFVGYVSSEPFDSAIITTPALNPVVTIDDLHFGVPAPGALGLFALAAIFGRPRRRAVDGADQGILLLAWEEPIRTPCSSGGNVDALVAEIAGLMEGGIEQ